MQRILGTCLLCAAVASLSGCWHSAFHTSIENGLDERAYVVIRFDDQRVPPGRGYLEPENRVNVPQSFEEIKSIDYQVGDHHCQLTKKEIVQRARIADGGLRVITLTQCRT